MMRYAILLLFLAIGCARLPADAPTLADERRPELAKKMGLGQEYEVTKRIEIREGDGEYKLGAVRQYGPITVGHVGYLKPGTRLRTEHVWYSPPEDDVGIASSVAVTMRVLPEHPFQYALKPADLPGGWIALPTGKPANAYVLAASHARVVDEHERTPEDQIVPLTEQQEWPRGRRR